MKINLIPDWKNKALRCHFCGATESVKYEIMVYDPVVDSKETKVCICNRCALRSIKV